MFFYQKTLKIDKFQKGTPYAFLSKNTQKHVEMIMAKRCVHIILCRGEKLTTNKVRIIVGKPFLKFSVSDDKDLRSYGH